MNQGNVFPSSMLSVDRDHKKNHAFEELLFKNHLSLFFLPMIPNETFADKVTQIQNLI